MGFKTFKEHFGIKNHIVSVEEGFINIGSTYVSKLARINMETGEIIINDAFGAFLIDNYPEMIRSTNQDRLALIKKEDKFQHSIPVYTFVNGQIIEKKCEELGFPNVTHDGEIMYENTHFTDKATAIHYALEDLNYKIVNYKESIADLEAKLAEKKSKI